MKSLFLFLGCIAFVLIFIFTILSLVSFVRKNGKTKNYILKAVLSFLIFLISVFNSQPSKNEIESSTPKNIEKPAETTIISNSEQMLFDATAYIGMTSQELLNMFGEQLSIETNNFENPSSHKHFILTTYSYQLNQIYFEFLFVDDKIVRINYYSDNTEKFKNQENIPWMFNIDPSSLTLVHDSGYVNRYKGYKEIQAFDVYGIENNSFWEVKITFDNSIFS